jgi:hypothetical protein
MIKGVAFLMGMITFGGTRTTARFQGCRFPKMIISQRLFALGGRAA